MRRLLRFVVFCLVLAVGFAWATTAVAEGSWQSVENKANCEVWNAHPQSSETIVWIGDCVNGRADGYGEAMWRYLADGEWKESSYTGTMRDGKRHGRGGYVWANGGRYDGEFKDGEMNGRGVKVWTSGSRYAGDFKDGKRHGRGVYLRANGEKYAGEWQDGVAHGYGVYTFSNGNECSGGWSSGNLIGTGKPLLWRCRKFVK